jgi:ABC-type multidrug transport system fused ATPase/permease subunit
MQNKIFIKSVLSLWLRISTDRKKEFFNIFILSIIASFLEVLSIGAFIPIITIAINSESMVNNKIINYALEITGIEEAKLKTFAVYFFCITVIISGLTRLILLRNISKFSLDTCADICADIYIRTISQPYMVQISRNSSNIIHTIIAQTNSLIYEVVLPILNILSSAIMGFIILMSIFIYSPTYSLLIFFLFALIYIAIGILTKKQLSLNSKIRDAESIKLVKVVQESLGSIRDILMDSSQKIYLKSFQDSNLKLRRTQAKIAFIGSSPRYIVETFGMVIIAFSILVGLNSEHKGAASFLPVLGGIALAGLRLLPIFQQAFGSWVAVRSGLISLNSVLNLLDQPITPTVERLKKLSFKKNIQFNAVTFKYKIESKPILDNIDLLIPKGSKIGIIGKTGSGKSTLLDILMGLLIPTSGQITVDGQEINDKNIYSWQANISHVPQSIYLSDGSILENIAFGIPEDLINTKLAFDCAKQAQIADVIENLPEGYSTIVGERGITLSGGQRQRVGIARALYKKSEIIIFDEATSSLDENTEQEVMNAINSLDPGLTIITVTHRKQTLKNCSTIYVVDDGYLKIANSADLN